MRTVASAILPLLLAAPAQVSFAQGLLCALTVPPAGEVSWRFSVKNETGEEIHAGCSHGPRAPRTDDHRRDYVCTQGCLHIMEDFQTGATTEIVHACGNNVMHVHVTAPEEGDEAWQTDAQCQDP